MDDKLYYVESPEGDVLGPMTMIQVLEGVAAGAVLDDARICEVGGGEWTSLSDVAYTHGQRLEDRVGVQHGAIDGDAGPHAAAASADVEELSFTPSWQQPAGEERPAPRHRVEAEPPARAPATPRLGPSRTGAPTPAPSVAASLEPSFPEEPTMVVAPAREPTRRPSGDFSLRMSHADTAAPRAADEGQQHRRPKWPIAVALAGAIAVIAIVYVVASGKLPFGKSADTPRETRVATETPRAVDPVEKGWQEIAAGNAAAALAALQPAVDAQPQNARAHHGLGRAALDTGNVDLALTHLAKACALDPKNAKMCLDLGRAQLSAGRPEQAAEQAARARALDPAEAGALWLLGRAEAARGRTKEAVESLASYVESNPKHVEARLDLAHALAAAGRVEAAIQEVGPYLDAHPEDRTMQVARLDWMMSVGQNAAAAKIYGPPAAQSPDDAFAQYLAGRAGEGTQEGAARLKRAVELDPKNRDAWLALARTDAAIGKTDAAVRDLERAFALHAPSAEEKALLAKIKKQAPGAASTQVATATPRRAEGATASTPSVRTLDERLAEIRRALAREDFRSVRHLIDTASAELRDPAAARNLSLWTAITDLEEGKLEQARDRLAALNPTASYIGFGPGAIANWLGRVQLARGDVRAAVGAFDQVGPEDPNEYATAQLWEGVALSALGMQDLAERTWTRVRDDVPGNVGPTGRAAVRSAEFLSGALAEKDYRTAVAPVPDFANDMHFFLGWAARTTDADAARDHFKAALDASRGREFPWQLAQSQMSGTGIGRK